MTLTPSGINKAMKVRRLLDEGRSRMEIAREVGCAPGYIYTVKNNPSIGARGLTPTVKKIIEMLRDERLFTYREIAKEAGCSFQMVHRTGKRYCNEDGRNRHGIRVQRKLYCPPQPPEVNQFVAAATREGFIAKPYFGVRRRRNCKMGRVKVNGFLCLVKKAIPAPENGTRILGSRRTDFDFFAHLLLDGRFLICPREVFTLHSTTLRLHGRWQVKHRRDPNDSKKIVADKVNLHSYIEKWEQLDLAGSTAAIYEAQK